MIDFDKNYILENNRVRLTPLALEDFEKLQHFALEEPDLWLYSLIQADSPDKMKSYIETAIESRNQKNAYPFLVFDKKENSFAGSTRFYDIQEQNGTLQLGYTWYGKKYQDTVLNKIASSCF